jgi:Tfp pilus assembly protein FimT
MISLSDPTGTRCRHASARQRRRTASTLLELMVTLALLAVLAGVVPLALRRIEPIRQADASGRLTAARRMALRTGRAVAVTTSAAAATYRAIALPDGSVVADTAFHVDRLTGVVRDTRTTPTEQSHAP